MVYIHFPANFTEEELMLQAKYQKLKKKKKAIQALKAPKPEPEKPIIPKRPAEARDAREVAKKLIKSGVIPAISKQQKQPEQGFKRPRGLERKLISDKTVSGYQPFSAVQMEDGPDNPQNTPPRIKNLYDTFANARDREERGLTEKQQQQVKTDKPRQGNTIYVAGYKITEEFLKKHFTTMGNIINISMEIEKNRGFITFDKTDAAERAISEMDGSMVSGIPLKVSLARRQPQIEPINDATSSAAWATLASSHSQKGNHRDKRNLVSYDDMFD
ncbi:negative elongation factor E [Diabrotica virgifera virgifera]|uniref:Negative elongation factor E n=1 Tax=Diabrotica virgifera virgifera TaxID=50390 RepID=A0A6P7EZJ9_DIAVI|nr:negative elongation factor E [Diabrotica virgifera virgifera]